MTPAAHRTVIPFGLFVLMAVGWLAPNSHPVFDEPWCESGPCAAAEIAAGQQAAWLAMIPGAVVLGIGVVLQFLDTFESHPRVLGIDLAAGLAVLGPFLVVMGMLGSDHFGAAVTAAFVVAVAASVSWGMGRVHGPRTDLAAAYLCALLPVALLVGIAATPFDALKHELLSAWIIVPLLVVAAAWGLAWVYRRRVFASRVATAP